MSEFDGRSRYSTPVGSADPGEVALFWERFLATTGVNAPVPPAECFGDTVELADELVELVLAGRKRATAGALAEYEAEGVPIPQVGELWIVTDGLMHPRAVLETTEVSVGPLSSVDDRFAWDEGEGDRTRPTWLDDHTWYFSRSLLRIGQPFHPDITIVFQRFVLRYP